MTTTNTVPKFDAVTKEDLTPTPPSVISTTSTVNIVGFKDVFHKSIFLENHYLFKGHAIPILFHEGYSSIHLHFLFTCLYDQVHAAGF